MKPQASKSGRVRRLAVHALRVLGFIAIVLLIRARSRTFLAARQDDGLGQVPLARIQRFLPAAASVRDTVEGAGVREVLDADGARLGSVLQSAPDSNPVIGFSGPSNLLIVFNARGCIVGVDVLSSGDTPEHVRRVLNDPQFLRSFNGLTWDEAAHRKKVDAVTGATLTSLAMAEGLERRLGGKPTSLKFPERVTVKDVRLLFPAATQVEPDAGEPTVIRVQGPKRQSLGWVLRTSPAADNLIGYQGPTDTLVGFDGSGKVVGLAVRKSYDNEPYVGYVRDDAYFRTLFNGKSFDELAGLNLEAAGVEGVSGATMTSMAVARGIVLAVQQKLAKSTPARPAPSPWEGFGARDVGTILVILAGTLIGLTHLRGIGWVRVVFQLVVFGYLGIMTGALLSQAQLVGWAQAGLPRGAWSLLLLTAAALLLPIATKRNVYCSHLCPHGALQQLALRGARPHYKVPHRWRAVLVLVPAGLLVWSLLVALTHWPFSLAHIEPFDAYVWRVAGWATLAIAVLGAVASLFVPMAYCRYGCPTGALLEYLRRHARSDRLTRRDALAVLCVLAAVVVWWVKG